VAEGIGIKICGLMRREDALAADRCGADYLGLVVTAGFSRSVAPERARAILDGTAARNVAVVVDEGVRGAAEAALAMGAEVIQLHGSEPPNELQELRRRGPWKLWKSVRAESLADVEQAVEQYGESADGILVEGRRAGVLGGGGARLALDGDSVRRVIPDGLAFVLAGGLRTGNVAEAVRGFGPDVVDVSSGVERTLGKKDHDLIRDFISAARGAMADPQRAPVTEGR
jgi:phosphoribosylanthranilate isomerase